MLDRDTKRKIKQKANELADLNLTDMKEFKSEHEKMYGGGEFTCGECFVIVRLVDLYIAIKQGLISEDEGRTRQKQILDVIELEDIRMKRLTKRYSNGNITLDAEQFKPIVQETIDREINAFEPFTIVVKRLAEYEDAE